MPRRRGRPASSPGSASMRRCSFKRWRPFPAAGACAWRLPRFCSPRLICCCSTSRPTISISNPGCGSKRSSNPIAARWSSSATSAICSSTSARLHSPSRARPHHVGVGGYEAFQRQRLERAAHADAARARQDAKRAKLQAYVDRWRYKAHTARQAQSRLKALARLQPIAAAVEDPTLVFNFPNPDDLRPPLITLDRAAVGYEAGKPVLTRLDLRIDPDDRIALLGRNGNGKTTLARLLSGALPLRQALHRQRACRWTSAICPQHFDRATGGPRTPLQRCRRRGMLLRWPLRDRAPACPPLPGDKARSRSRFPRRRARAACRPGVDHPRGAAPGHLHEPTNHLRHRRHGSAGPGAQRRGRGDRGRLRRPPSSWSARRRTGWAGVGGTASTEFPWAR